MSVRSPTYTMFRPCTTFSWLGDRSFFFIPRVVPSRKPSALADVHVTVDRPLFLPIDKRRQRITDAQAKPIPTFSTPRNPLSLFLLFLLALSGCVSVKRLSDSSNRGKPIAVCYVDTTGQNAGRWLRIDALQIQRINSGLSRGSARQRSRRIRARNPFSVCSPSSLRLPSSNR